MIIAYAYSKRTTIGRTASNLATVAGYVMVARIVFLAPTSGFLDDVARHWVETGHTVPALWRYTQNALPTLSSVLQVAVVILLAAAVFAPRRDPAAQPVAGDL